MLFRSLSNIFVFVVFISLKSVTQIVSNAAGGGRFLRDGGEDVRSLGSTLGVSGAKLCNIYQVIQNISNACRMPRMF